MFRGSIEASNSDVRCLYNGVEYKIPLLLFMFKGSLVVGLREVANRYQQLYGTHHHGEKDNVPQLNFLPAGGFCTHTILAGVPGEQQRKWKELTHHYAPKSSVIGFLKAASKKCLLNANDVDYCRFHLAQWTADLRECVLVLFFILSSLILTLPHPTPNSSEL